MKLYSKLLSVLLFFTAYLFSCQKNVDQPPVLADKNATQRIKPNNPGFVDNNMVMYWNEKAATVLGIPMRQPDRSRYFAIIEIAVHDALNNIKPKYERFILNEREQFADPDAAVASAAYWAIKGLNQQRSFPVDTWYKESLATIPDGESKEFGKTLGKHAAEAIIANRANDGFSDIIVGSPIPANGVNPGEYRSTLTYAMANGAQTLIQFPVRPLPNWGKVMKPYVIENNKQFRSTAPYSVTSADYTTDFNEVKIKGARVGSNRTETEEKIAHFWSENRPSIIWNQFVREAVNTKKMDAWKTTRLFALMHVCMAESINTQLNAAYYFYFWRPETGIRLAASDGNDDTNADAEWLPFIAEVPNAQITPPVPGYPNAYAAFGGATAEILRLFFDTDDTSIDFTTTNPVVPSPITFHYSSFSQAARESSLSMIDSGWDFRNSVLKGEEMGKQIASYVFSHAFREE